MLPCACCSTCCRSLSLKPIPGSTKDICWGRNECNVPLHSSSQLTGLPSRLQLERRCLTCWKFSAGPIYCWHTQIGEGHSKWLALVKGSRKLTRSAHCAYSAYGSVWPFRLQVAGEARSP